MDRITNSSMRDLKFNNCFRTLEWNRYNRMRKTGGSFVERAARLYLFPAWMKILQIVQCYSFESPCILSVNMVWLIRGVVPRVLGMVIYIGGKSAETRRRKTRSLTWHSRRLAASGACYDSSVAIRDYCNLFLFARNVLNKRIGYSYISFFLYLGRRKRGKSVETQRRKTWSLPWHDRVFMTFFVLPW